MAENIPEWQRLTHYCKKHNQHYMEFLHECPICVGEYLADLPKTPLGGLNIAEDMVPNKMYGPETDRRPQRAQKPEQLSLF